MMCKLQIFLASGEDRTLIYVIIFSATYVFKLHFYLSYHNKIALHKYPISVQKLTRLILTTTNN